MCPPPVRLRIRHVPPATARIVPVLGLSNKAWRLTNVASRVQLSQGIGGGAILRARQVCVEGGEASEPATVVAARREERERQGACGRPGRI